MSELAHGLLLQEQGRLEEAESCFYAVLAGDPENDFVYSRLALCQMAQQGKKKRALEAIAEAIRIRPEDGFHHSVHSLILSDLQRGKESLVAAETAIGLDPEDAFALATKANAYCTLDRWSDAEEWSRRALAVDGDSSMAANILTHALRMQGKSSENEVAVEKLLAANPEDSLAHINAGWGALQRKDCEQAEVHFREALRLDPESEMAREGLLDSFRARSRFYRMYLSYCFFMQRFTGGRQWMIILGIYLAYQGARLLLQEVNPIVAGVLACAWLGLVMWIWLAPGIGNFLVLLDRSARLALKRGERRLGIAVGGGLLLGIAGLVVGYVMKFDPAILLGLGLLTSTIPASLAFANDSPVGKRLFGSITGLLYLISVVIFALETSRLDAEEWHPVTLGLGTLGLIAAIACTWLGNLRSLRLKREE